MAGTTTATADKDKPLPQREGQRILPVGKPREISCHGRPGGATSPQPRASEAAPWVPCPPSILRPARAKAVMRWCPGVEYQRFCPFRAHALLLTISPRRRFACLGLTAFGPSARSLYPHLADGVLCSHGKLVQTTQEGVAWLHQPEIPADPKGNGSKGNGPRAPGQQRHISNGLCAE